jgi:hypothetical protein
MQPFYFLEEFCLAGYKAVYACKASKKPENSSCYMLHADFLLGLFFGTEDGGDMFLRKIG